MTMNMRTSDVEMLSGSLLLFEQGMQLFAPFAPFVKTYCTLFSICAGLRRHNTPPFGFSVRARERAYVKALVR